jgi:hypothetical protein
MPGRARAEVLQVIEPTDLAQERAHRLDGATLFLAAAGRVVAARRSFGQDPVQPIQVAADHDKVSEFGEAILLDGHDLSYEANQQLGLASGTRDRIGNCSDPGKLFGKAYAPFKLKLYLVVEQLVELGFREFAVRQGIVVHWVRLLLMPA